VRLHTSPRNLADWIVHLSYLFLTNKTTHIL